MISLEEQKRFIKTVKNACDFFRSIRIWPLEANLDYEGWVNNFNGTKDQYLASIILWHFIYYPQSMIQKLLYDAVGNACGHFKESNLCWQHDHHKRNVFYSFIPGETPNPTDSGFTYLKIRFHCCQLKRSARANSSCLSIMLLPPVLSVL